MNLLRNETLKLLSLFCTIVVSFPVENESLTEETVTIFSIMNTSDGITDNVTHDIPESSPFFQEIWNMAVFAGFKLFVITWLAQFMAGFLVFCYILCGVLYFCQVKTWKILFTELVSLTLFCTCIIIIFDVSLFDTAKDIASNKI